MNNIVMVGKPNTGKSLLFNQLTGLKQKVANYPGVTVELKQGHCEEFGLIDLPGTYSLDAMSSDEKIAVQEIRKFAADEDTRLIVCVLDATRLETSLLVGLQVQNLALETGKPVLFALNFIDQMQRISFTFDVEGLASQLGAPIVALSARSLEGFAEFKSEILALARSEYTPDTDAPIDGPQDFVKTSHGLAEQFGVNTSVLLKKQNRIDQFLLHKWAGGSLFMFSMFVLFQSIFTFAVPLMDGVEWAIGLVAQSTLSVIPEGIFADFMADAVFGGIGAFLVFVPQIMVLTFIIGLLEDSGYLARAALICHRPLSFFGLSGRSFIPYLSAHACAIPALMAARTIESPRKRLITMLTIPLMSCSARLPVYGLLITVLIPETSDVLGVFNTRGVAFFGLFLFGMICALAVGHLLSKYTQNNEDLSDMPFIIELPDYRLPHWRPLASRVIQSGQSFIRRAAPIIFVVTAGIWFLGYFPQGADLQDSWLGQIGQFIEPIFVPMGLDWNYGVAILMSFLAREVFVGALGTMLGMQDAETNESGLIEKITSNGLEPGAGLGLLLFYVVALQCVATVATLKGETGSGRLAWGVFIVYGLLAYLISVSVYQFSSYVL